MKNVLLMITISFYVLELASCSPNFKTKNKVENIENSCLPGYIMIVYIGENSAPTPPTLMRTDQNDTIYHQYMGDSYELHMRNDFTISESLEKYYMTKIIINAKDYFVLKQYIISHNTKKDKIKQPEDYSLLSPFKVILSDKCDSITYIVDKENVDYFNHFLDSTELYNNEELKSRIDYYKRMTSK